MGGWIKFHRKILDNEIWQDVTAFRLFTLLLLKASHKDGIKTRGIEVNRGQYLRAYSKLAEDLEYMEGRGFKKVSKSTVERKVKKLVDASMVSVSETVSGTLFTITKYDDYQGADDVNEITSGTDKETNVGRTRDDRGTNVVQEQELKNLRTKELKNKDIKNSPKQVYDEDSPPFILADFFYKEILKNDPKRKEPNLQTWSDDIRKMIELDKRDKKEIGELMRWVQQDEFERANVLSPSKLRTRYTSLLLKMNKPKFPSIVKSVAPPIYKGVESNRKNDGKNSTEFGNVRLFK